MKTQGPEIHEDASLTWFGKYTERNKFEKGEREMEGREREREAGKEKERVRVILSL